MGNQLTKQIYRRLLNEEESLSGLPTRKPRDLDGNQVLQTDERARTLYIQREEHGKLAYGADCPADLQELRGLTNLLLGSLCRSTQHLPYTVRLLAREALLALRVFEQIMCPECTHAWLRSNTQTPQRMS